MRLTIDLDPQVIEGLKARAAEVHASVSELVNVMLRDRLAEDLEDLAAFEERAGEPETPLEEVISDLKAGGRL